MQENRWSTLLERVVPALFGLVVILALVRLLVDESPTWLVVAWQVTSVAFVLLLLSYLNSDGTQRVTDGDGPLTAAGRVGVTGLALLTLAVLANLATWLFDIESPVWEAARTTVGIGFAVCFVLYVALRYRQRRRHRVSTSHDSEW